MGRLIALIVLAVTAGCTSIAAPQYTKMPPPPPEVPLVNPPEELRQRNWVSKSPSSYGQGSCVHASSVTLFRWLGHHDLAEQWRAKKSGGETASTILAQWLAAGIPYCSTRDPRTGRVSGDPRFLDWASETRRGAIIWYKPSHCVTFCGFTEIEGKKHAIIVDNNTPQKYDNPIPYEQFIREWRGYGGFAATPVFTPTGPLPWPIALPTTSQ